VPPVQVLNVLILPVVDVEMNLVVVDVK